MNIPAFFKILNKKIEKYDKIASNPFLKPQSIVLIWVENIEPQKNNYKNKD